MMMTPSELHTKLLKLKHLGKSPSPEYINAAKSEIRAELKDYHARIPDLNGYRRHGELEERGRLRDASKAKNIVFYSFLNNPNKPHIAEHEYKRLKISWESLRKHNPDIEVRFCLGGELTDKEKQIWSLLAEANNVVIFPFHDSFSADFPNAWCIHRWYNLMLWTHEDLNILYMDADTYINADIQFIFDLYCRDAIYGREELGFRHDPNSGVSGEDARFFLDLVDASIVAQGGVTEVQKYCLGVILLNHSIHRNIATKENLKFYTELLHGIHKFELFYSIPNYRIMDEFAFWILLSKLSIRTSLFGNQDVSHTFLEEKHATHFNPVVLHYTTKDEEKFADWAPEFMCLSRTEERRQDSDMGAGGIYNINPMMREELAMSMW